MKKSGWLWLLLLVPMVAGLVRLRFDVEVLNLLPDRAPGVQGLKLYQRYFSNARELFITVDAPSPETAESAALLLAETLRRRTDLAAAVMWQPPWQENPAQSAELIAYLWFNHPPEALAGLTNKLAPEKLNDLLEQNRERLATTLSPEELSRLSFDPYGLMQLPQSTEAEPEQQLFSSQDGRFRIVTVQAKGDLASYREALAWLRAVREAVEPEIQRQYPEIKLGYTGRPAFVAEIARGMERDITQSVLGTMALIMALFWWAHRRWRPMFWLMLMLVVTLAGATALGGLFFGAVNVVSLGFAAILLGLAVDYGLVLYQEALAHPEASSGAVRKIAARGIIWSAVSTAGSFSLLNLSRLPGLAQLGSLVALGVTLGATVMLFWFLPPLIRWKLKPAPVTGKAPVVAQISRRPWVTVVAAAVLFAWGAWTWWRSPPALDPSADALRPEESQASEALQKIKDRMGQSEEPLWVVVSAPSLAEAGRRLDQISAVLERARSSGAIERFTLSSQLLPRPEFQEMNRAAARHLVEQRDLLFSSALEHGFTTNALAMTRAILDTWSRAVQQADVFWPTNPLSRWTLEKLVARSPGEFIALGFFFPVRRAPLNELLSAPWVAELRQEGVWVAGWGVLGFGLWKIVQADLLRIVPWVVLLLVGSLWLAFQRWQEVLLSMTTLILTFVCLFLVMHWAGWQWNLMNIMALPLLVGLGVDYTIHMQLALRRNGGNLVAARQTIGRALLLCAGTTIAGFGSLGFSANAGMASLGKVCASGIGIMLLLSLYLLPGWWLTFKKPESTTGAR